MSGPARTHDVVIVGGGVIGSAIAYFLLGEPGFAGTVALIERDPSFRTASSALSASGIRQQYSTEVNIAIGLFGIEFLRRVAEHLEVDGEAPDIALREKGYLFLADAVHEAQMRENHARQRRLGADVALLAPGDLSARFPWINADDVALGSLGLSGEGWFDGYGLMRAFRRKARSLGAELVTGEVVALERAGAKIVAAELADGSRIGCGAVVNAAGPRARLVAEMAGLALPVEARPRSVFVVDCKEELPGCPLIVDSTAVWMRPEGRQFIAGVQPPEDRDGESFELEIDHALFEEIVWPALANRIPAFAALKLASTWAGHYAYNTVDQNAILGPHPEVPNLFFANGFSGHGLQQSPAVGRGIAEWIVHGGPRSLDLTPLSIRRLLEGRPLIERNVC